MKSFRKFDNKMSILEMLSFFDKGRRDFVGIFNDDTVEEYYSGSNIYCDNGKEVWLIAHYDKVWDYFDKKVRVGVVNNSKDRIVGYGLDNSVGCALVYMMWKRFGENVNYMFTDGEEIGGRGIEAVCKKGFFKNGQVVINIEIADDAEVYREIGKYGLSVYIYKNTSEKVKNIIRDEGVVVKPVRFNDSVVVDAFGIETVSFHVQIEGMHGLESVRKEYIESSVISIGNIIDKLLN